MSEKHMFFILIIAKWQKNTCFLQLCKWKDCSVFKKACFPIILSYPLFVSLFVVFGGLYCFLCFVRCFNSVVCLCFYPEAQQSGLLASASRVLHEWVASKWVNEIRRVSPTISVGKKKKIQIMRNKDTFTNLEKKLKADEKEMLFFSLSTLWWTAWASGLKWYSGAFIYDVRFLGR